jgi:hypothetical protein
MPILLATNALREDDEEMPGPRVREDDDGCVMDDPGSTSDMVLGVMGVGVFDGEVSAWK